MLPAPNSTHESLKKNQLGFFYISAKYLGYCRSQPVTTEPLASWHNLANAATLSLFFDINYKFA